MTYQRSFGFDNAHLHTLRPDNSAIGGPRDNTGASTGPTSTTPISTEHVNGDGPGRVPQEKKLSQSHPNRKKWSPWLKDAVEHLEDMIGSSQWKFVLGRWLDIEHVLEYPERKVCRKLSILASLRWADV